MASTSNFYPVDRHIPQAEPEKAGENSSPYIDRGPALPEHYGKRFLTALVRDPNCVFVMWELLGDVHGDWVIRTLNIGSGEMTTEEVFAGTGKFYVNGLAEDSPYAFELGRFVDGIFILAMRSNDIRTPRGTPAERYDEEWTPQGKEAEELEKLYTKTSPLKQTYQRPGSHTLNMK